MIPPVRRAWRALGSLYKKAYEDNLTGLSAMVAYNLLLSLLPVALVALFVAGRVLRSTSLEHSVVRDLQDVFPSTAKSTITHALERVKDSSTSFGLVAIVASLWFGSSFWGSLDTAFCRIYHLDCRKWLAQKRFSLAMLAIVLLLMAATVVVPTAQSILISGAHGLPFGLSRLHGFVYAITLALGLFLLFVLLSLVYWLVPKGRVPWRAIWPGALTATLAIGAVDVGFPVYLSNISTVARLGTTLVLIVIVLLWFYAVALLILVGAVVNAVRFEHGRVLPAAGPAPVASAAGSSRVP